MLDYDNDYQIGIFYCDSCDNEQEIEGDFQDVVAEIKRFGWRIRKEKDEWCHYCPVCIEKTENVTN